MAYDESLKSVSYDADASLAVWTSVPGQPGSAASPNHGGKQYHFVKITGNHTVGLADADDTNVVGVLQNKPQVTGQAATVAIGGVSRVIADVALTAGDKVKVSADGQAAKAGSGPSVGTVVLGAGAGEIASVQLELS